MAGTPNGMRCIPVWVRIPEAPNPDDKLALITQWFNAANTGPQFNDWIFFVDGTQDDSALAGLFRFPAANGASTQAATNEARAFIRSVNNLRKQQIPGAVDWSFAISGEPASFGV